MPSPPPPFLPPLQGVAVGGQAAERHRAGCGGQPGRFGDPSGKALRAKGFAAEGVPHDRQLRAAVDELLDDRCAVRALMSAQR
jgi:hypothetical protein